MAKPQQQTTLPPEPWWPPRLASPLWWDDRIAGWHALGARLLRRTGPADADPAIVLHQRRPQPPRAAGELAAAELGWQTIWPEATATADPNQTRAIPVAVQRADEGTTASAHETVALRDQVAAQEREIAALSAQLATRATSPDRDQQWASLQAQVADSQAVCAERDRQIAELRGDRVAMEERCAQLQRVIDEARRNHDSLAALVITLRAELDARDGHIAELEAGAASIARDRDLLHERIATYKRIGVARLDELRQLYAEFAQRTAWAEGERDELLARLGRQWHEDSSPRAAR